MNPRVSDVIAKENYILNLTFDNTEKKEFDMKPYINKGFFKQLQQKNYFCSVQIFMGSIQWPNGQDLCPDTLYENSTKIMMD